ncbi:MAG: DUF6677 family protein [Terriglobia bacterium]
MTEKQRTAEGRAAVHAPAADSDRQPKAETSRLVTLCIAAWLVPGLGHWMLKKKVRAAILFFAIIGMFIFGILMQGQFFAMASPSYLERLGYLGELCAGLAAPVAKFFGYSGGNPFFVSADYGTAYLVTAGMLNVLAILDAYDIALRRKP